MNEANAHSQVPGQVVLPGMAEEMGYEAIKLPVAQERFCHEYVLRNSNGTRAYLTVHPGVSEKSARTIAARLLAKVGIINRIDQIRQEMRRKYSVTAEDIVEYHSRVLKIDRREYLSEDGKPRKVEDIDGEAASILEFDCERDAKFGKVLVMFKIPQRHQSAVELARILGLHKDNLDLGGKLGIEHSGAVGKSEDALKLEALREKFRSMTNGAADTSS